MQLGSTKEKAVATFELGLAIGGLGYHLKHTETDTLHLIVELEIWGDFAFAQDEVVLTVSRLGERVYGAGEASFGAGPWSG